MDAYLPRDPDFIAVDQISLKISREIKTNMATTVITPETSSIENHKYIWVVERCNLPLCAGFTKLRPTLDKCDVKESDCLRIAVFTNNATMVPEDLWSIFPLFGALPLPGKTAPSPKQLEIQVYTEEAKRAVYLKQSQRRIYLFLSATQPVQNT